MLGGFLALWLSFAFLVNKAPNYTRLLVTLPFVAFLVTEAVRWLVGRWRSIPRGPAVLAAGFLGAHRGLEPRDRLGLRPGGPPGWRSDREHGSVRRGPQGQCRGRSSTWRRLTQQPYCVWGHARWPASPTSRTIRARSGPSTPPACVTSAPRRRSRSSCGERSGRRLRRSSADRYPRGRIRNVTPDGARVVLEVPS